MNTIGGLLSRPGWYPVDLLVGLVTAMPLLRVQSLYVPLQGPFSRIGTPKRQVCWAGHNSTRKSIHPNQRLSLLVVLWYLLFFSFFSVEASAYTQPCQFFVENNVLLLQKLPLLLEADTIIADPFTIIADQRLFVPGQGFMVVTAVDGIARVKHWLPESIASTLLVLLECLLHHAPPYVSVLSSILLAFYSRVSAISSSTRFVSRFTIPIIMSRLGHSCR